jgi:hypothetical protein
MKVSQSAVAMTIALLVVTVGVPKILATDVKGRFYAFGAGQKSCDVYIQFRDKRMKDFTPEQYEITGRIVRHWVAGFLTAHNYYVTDTYDVTGRTSFEELLGWLEKHCRENPDKYFAEAVVALGQHLDPNRITVGTTAAAQEKTPSGTLAVKAKSIAIGVGVTWGDGHLKFKGKDHAFSISGLSLIDMGFSSVSATGNVYNLKKVSDFAGTYVAAKAGITLGGGSGGMVMQNQNDVLINVTGITQGAKLSLGPAGVTIKLKE